ncbi:hypothetical protein NDU88_005025 [Pleurodeles waltl]|uniref:Uncharacterized protein n=1 Tax=Pleurodeles waltl TaxID=8319 RepID=A0AAV7TTM3_PLEWA|nr:hypothetical protein NDU88_005025 [Pleurodeles waltl]
MGAPLQHGGNLSGAPGASPGLCWLRARLELGRSRRLAAQLPFRVKASRVSTEADRLPFEGKEVPSLKPAGRWCRRSTIICFFPSKAALQDKVGGGGSEGSHPGIVHCKLDSMRHHNPPDRQRLPRVKPEIAEGSGKGGLKPPKNIKIRKKNARSKLTPSVKTFLKVKSPDKLVIMEDGMNGSVPKALAMEAKGEGGCQGGRHSHDMQQQSLMASIQTLVCQEKVGEALVSEEIVPKSEFPLAATPLGSGDPVFPL